MPFLLTGNSYDNSIPIQQFIKKAYLTDSSIPKVLMENGFESQIFATNKYIFHYNKSIISNLKERENNPLRQKDLARFYDLSFFRYMPHLLKQFVYNDNEWRFVHYIRRFAHYIKDDSKRKKQLKIT